MYIHFIDTFNELKILHKCKLWWDGSLNERGSMNQRMCHLAEPHAFPQEFC